MLTDAELAAFRRERTACVVGRKTAARFGWKIGQTITLRGTIFPGDWPMTIRGIFRGRDKTADESPLLFHWDYLNEGIKRTAPGAADAVGWYLVGVEGPGPGGGGLGRDRRHVQELARRDADRDGEGLQPRVHQHDRGDHHDDPARLASR